MTRRRCPPSTSPVAVDVTALAEALALVPIPVLLTYADKMLTRLVVAKILLERRDPDTYRAWFNEIERIALDAMHEVD